MKAIAGTLAAAAVLLFAGCNGTPDTPTAPTTPTTPSAITGHFIGSLTVGESRFYSFTASREGVVSATLASVTAPRTGAALDVPLGVGIGRPEGTGCPTVTSRTSSSSLNAQVQLAITAGIHCIAVYDDGGLTSDINFAVRFSHP